MYPKWTDVLIIHPPVWQSCLSLWSMGEEEWALRTTLPASSVWGRGLLVKVERFILIAWKYGLRSKISESTEQSNTKEKSNWDSFKHKWESTDYLLGTLSVSGRHPCAQRKLVRRAVSPNRSQIVSGWWEASNPEAVRGWESVLMWRMTGSA